MISRIEREILVNYIDLEMSIFVPVGAAIMSLLPQEAPFGIPNV